MLRPSPSRHSTWMLALAAMASTLLGLTVGGATAAAAPVSTSATATAANEHAPRSNTAPPDEPPAATAPGTGTLVYEGTSVRNSFSGDGEGEETYSDEVSIEFTCVEFECELVNLPYWLRHIEGTITAVDAALTVSWTVPASGTPCADADDPDYYSNSSVGTATVTTTSFTATGEEEPSGWVDCSETEASLRWGSNLSLDAELVSGDPCVLDADACPEPEPLAALAVATTAVTPSTPSSLSGLSSPDETLAPQQVFTAALLTLVLVILLALPTALLNSASSTGAEKVAEWRARVAARRAALGSGLPSGVRTMNERASAWWARASTAKRGLPLAAATLLAAAILSGFVDPDFGTGSSTPRVLLSIVLGFTLEVLLGWVAMLILVPRIIAGVDARLDVRPATLLIVLGAVIVTRLTGFEPGIVFGLVAGVAVGATLATAARVRVALLGLGWGYGLAVLAWITYAALEPAVLEAAAASPDGLSPLGLVLLREALATMTIAGIAALPVALVPVRGLTGHEVWAWSKPLWAGLYGLGLFSFFVVLMPMPFAWAGVEAALATWIAGYLVYAGVAVALWLAITQPWRKGAAPEPVLVTSTTQD